MVEQCVWIKVRKLEDGGVICLVQEGVYMLLEFSGIIRGKEGLRGQLRNVKRHEITLKKRAKVSLNREYTTLWKQTGFSGCGEPYPAHCDASVDTVAADNAFSSADAGHGICPTGAGCGGIAGDGSTVAGCVGETELDVDGTAADV